MEQNNNINELKLVKEFQKYLDYKSPRDDGYWDYDFTDQYPQAINELYRFFNGRLNRIEKYPELYNLYQGLYEFYDKYRQY